MEALANMDEPLRSVYSDQQDILNAIEKLHVPEGYQCDVTYGNGVFWKGRSAPLLKFDIDPQVGGVVAACSTMLPLETASIRNLVFDPPFLTYVRSGRCGNGKMVMSKRYSGYWRYEELEEHYHHSISEAHRVLQRGGVYVFKCQDIIHNHRLHCTHANVIRWAELEGFRLLDLFVLTAQRRMPSPNRVGAQKHARIFHSYFLVFRKP